MATISRSLVPAKVNDREKHVLYGSLDIIRRDSSKLCIMGTYTD